MNATVGKRARIISYVLTLVYFASYCTRINFTVMLVKIGSEMSVTKEELSIVVTALTVSYGVGQIISGMLGDRIKAPLLLTAGLSVASICNALMFFMPSVYSMTAVWCVNGFAQSLLWPPIVRIMSTSLNDSEYSYAAVRVSWGSSIATICMYTVIPLLLYAVSWRAVMIICAFVGALIALVWRVVYPRLLSEENKNSESKEDRTLKAAAVKGEKLPSFVYVPIALIMLGIILQGILRDGVAGWMPSYLHETFNIPEEKAIISTVIQAIFSMLSFYVFDVIHRKLFKNEVTCSAVIFALAAVCAVALYVLNMFFDSVLLSLLLMAVIVGCMHGINLMLITVVPKRMIRSGKVSTWSGILNSCTYIGASLSMYGFAAMANSKGWNFTILMWGVVAFLGTAVCTLGAFGWKRFKREFSDK